MQYTNDGMYVVEEKGVFRVCCEECNAIYQRWDVVVEEKGVCSVCCEELMYTVDGKRKVCLVSAVRSVMQYTNDGMYVVEEKGVSSLCCEECNAIYQ